MPTLQNHYQFLLIRKNILAFEWKLQFSQFWWPWYQQSWVTSLRLDTVQAVKKQEHGVFLSVILHEDAFFECLLLDRDVVLMRLRHKMESIFNPTQFQSFRIYIGAKFSWLHLKLYYFTVTIASTLAVSLTRTPASI